ncbi:MAG TPA: phosphatidylserine decarboxylase, partial [Acidobacteriota bacterium]|nr:phosphatidylserine decarboxylase [Acidobacteriota bacterium]
MAKKSKPRCSDHVIADLAAKLKKDKKLEKMLVQSLKIAKDKAKAELDKLLYSALDWPTTRDRYLKYLTQFSRWIPRQSTNPAWTDPGTDEQQEVYDRLCHFYFLVDQQLPDGRIVENDEWFSNWLVEYADLWGSFLNATDSFDDEVLQSFMDDSPEYRVQDSMFGDPPRPNAPSGWLTFNQFFARELNPGLRPVSSPESNSVIVSPADCTYRNHFPIGPNSDIDEITVKKTHKYANVKDLLEGSPYADRFANGTFLHYFLGPYSYHRFHTPVAGLLKECRAVSGEVYLEVNLSGRQFDAPDTSQGGYEFTQARGIVILDTSNSPAGNVGLLGVVPIGMAQVSSVNMTA